MKKKGQKILIVVSRYNELITSGLERHTIDYLSNNSSFEKHVVEASGAFEIPFIIEKYIKGYDGVIALGCIIKGETNNFELISQSVTNAIINLSIKHKKPIGNGIITCFNGKQAKARTKKGAEAAAAVVNFFNGSKPLKLD